METNHHSHTNGKSTLVSTAIVPAAPDSRPGKQQGHSRLAKLIGDAVDLELKLKATMAEIGDEMQKVGQSELPSVLLSLMRPTQPQPPAPASPALAPLAKAHPRAGKKTVHHVQNRGGKLKAQVMGLMSDGRERKSLTIVKELKAKNPTSIYSILSDLAAEGHLIRTRFAHYRLKMRKG